MKKLLTALVVAMLVLAFAVPAFAYSDTDSTAVGKLSGLGIVNGYPDGTYKPAANITRAEFAKIAVVAAGLKDSAASLAAAPSKFTDVKAGSWYTGWVNIAASQGYIKGYPDKTFKPEANVTNAEVITVLVRLLGYNDNLVGEWPVNYLTKAASIDVTKGITYTSSAPATRLLVAQFTDQTIDKDIYYYDKDKEKFVAEAPATTLLKQNFDSALTKDVRPTSWTITDGQYSVAFNGGASVKVSKTFSVGGAGSIPAAMDVYAEYITNDDSEIVYLGVKAYGVEKADEYEVKDADTIKINGKEFDIANANVAFVGTIDGTKRKDSDGFKVVLDKDGKVGFIKLNSAVSSLKIIKSVDVAAKKVTYKNNGATDDLAADDKYLIVKGGKVVDFADLAENDIVEVTKGDGNVKGNLDAYFSVGNKKVTGKLTGADLGNVKVTVDTTKYEVSTGTLGLTQISSDSFVDKFAALSSTATDLKDYFNKDVTLLLDRNGDVFALGASVTATTKAKGVLISAKTLSPLDASTAKYTVTTADGDKDYIKVTKEDGTRVTLEVKSGVVVPARGILVEYTLNSDNKVDTITDIDGAQVNTQDADKDNRRINVGGAWKVVSNTVVVFKTAVTETEDADKVKIGTYASFEKAADAGAPGVNFFYVEKDGVITHIVVAASALTTANDYAMVISSGINADGKKALWLDVKGTTISYVYEDATVSNYHAGDFVKYTVTDSTVSSILKVKEYNNTTTAIITDMVGATYEIADSNSYLPLDKDAVVYDGTSEEAPKYGYTLAKDLKIQYADDANDGDIDWVIVRD